MSIVASADESKEEAPSSQPEHSQNKNSLSVAGSHA